MVDSGCDIHHPALAGNIIDIYNFTSDKQNVVKDHSGHGTHVAGIIAADNTEKLISVAPKAKLLILKVVSDQPTEYKNMIDAVNFATKWSGPNNEKVSVINLSLSGIKHNSQLRDAILKANSTGITVVAAAGNQGDGDPKTEELRYPGGYPEVIEVGAMNSDGGIAHFSNTNKEIDILAPGSDILSTIPGGQYSEMTGTSMAAPHVSGVCALLYELNKDSLYGRTFYNTVLIRNELLKHTRRTGLQTEFDTHLHIK